MRFRWARVAGEAVSEERWVLRKVVVLVGAATRLNGCAEGKASSRMRKAAARSMRGRKIVVVGAVLVSVVVVVVSAGSHSPFSSNELSEFIPCIGTVLFLVITVLALFLCPQTVIYMLTAALVRG
jgi:hypothetical protein